ncbi:uncharacterized protein LOC143295461 [Babylonia areolata]|uniref:uncharacterized protein LOC143295461 n=1 Tax=Babylonia areolata TaxID=304850 RepID=UPI003FCF951D
MAKAEKPDYTLNEHDESYVRVRVLIPNLKGKKQGLMGKLTGGGRRDQAKNAQIDGDFQERSFTLTVTGDPVKDMENKMWTLSSSELPYAIDPDACYWKTEDRFVCVFLKKASNADDWASVVRKGIDS